MGGSGTPGILDPVAVGSPEAPLGGQDTAEGKVVDKIVDAARGIFGVRLELPNPKYPLPAGLKCKVIFQ